MWQATEKKKIDSEIIICVYLNIFENSRYSDTKQVHGNVSPCDFLLFTTGTCFQINIHEIA